MTSKWFEPTKIVVSADVVWLVDQLRPIALAIRDGRADLAFWDGNSSYLERLFARIRADGAGGLVVQEADQVIRIGSDSVPIDSAGLELVAADTDAVWLAGGTDAGDRLVVADRTGSRIEIPTPAPVRGVEFDGADVVVVLAERPIEHAPFEYPTSAVRVARQVLLRGEFAGDRQWRPGFPAGLNIDDWEEVEAFQSVDSDHRWTWLETDAGRVQRYGLRAGGLAWALGADPDGDQIHRRVVVRGHDPSSGEVIVDLDAGAGLVCAAAVVSDEIWIVVARRRMLRVSQDQGVEVIAVSADGTVRSVLAPRSIDVSAANPLLLPRPTDEEIAAAVGVAVRELEATVARMDCPRLRDRWRRLPPVEVRGDWPGTTVSGCVRRGHVRAGLLLRRTFAVFGPRGEIRGFGIFGDIADEWRDACDNWEEDLQSGYIAPAHEAVDGVLET